MTFGDYDVMVVVAMPDKASAAAFSIKAMRKTAKCGYRPVGKS
jgi:uncharacterized protein with GYD domain